MDAVLFDFAFGIHFRMESLWLTEEFVYSTVVPKLHYQREPFHEGFDSVSTGMILNFRHRSAYVLVAPSDGRNHPFAVGPLFFKAQ
ncbi:hypothetical protein [uncultured Dialister sp.]|uniref:hypothetical protein n=1 Tax=uncultured Dialister sp. TaxID=278064 RepID=UPI0025FC9F1B|nr:hypothetical protein [uncultured Dialister sp.]